ncbi:hypothetical protein BDY24DRAFT_160112 [Mrakia frigida]|uniref:uncharacterized protein n=1 Tax=Mrakia frigida TaxID=29902 RepID=UPI003FCC1679
MAGGLFSGVMGLARESTLVVKVCFSFFAEHSLSRSSSSALACLSQSAGEFYHRQQRPYTVEPRSPLQPRDPPSSHPSKRRLPSSSSFPFLFRPLPTTTVTTRLPSSLPGSNSSRFGNPFHLPRSRSTVGSSNRLPTRSSIPPPSRVRLELRRQPYLLEGRRVAVAGTSVLESRRSSC